MQVTRRRSAILGGSMLLGAVALSGTSAVADATDEAAVGQAAEALRAAMLKRDTAQLQAVLADQLSYGHSDGHVETKARFIEVVAGGMTLYKSITLSETTTVLSGDAAVVRNVFAAEVETGGQASTPHLHVIQVWQKQAGAWKLLARQGFKT
jgi:ketosteroid isomerase-like protein